MDKARNIELEIRMINTQIALAVRNNVNYNNPGPRAAHIRKLIELRPLIGQDRFYELTKKQITDYVKCFHEQVRSEREFKKIYGEPERDPNANVRANSPLEQCRDLLRFIYNDNPDFTHPLMLQYPMAWSGLHDDWAQWTRMIDD